MIINQKAWQPSTETTYVQVSHRITNTEQIKVAGYPTQTMAHSEMNNKYCVGSFRKKIKYCKMVYNEYE